MIGASLGMPRGGPAVGPRGMKPCGSGQLGGNCPAPCLPATIAGDTAGAGGFSACADCSSCATLRTCCFCDPLVSGGEPDWPGTVDCPPFAGSPGGLGGIF